MFTNRGGRETNKYLTGAFVAKKWWLPLLKGRVQSSLCDIGMGYNDWHGFR